MSNPTASDDRPDPKVRASGAAPLRIDRTVVQQIGDHVAEDTTNECGGVLVGTVDGSLTVITAAIRAQHTVAHASSLTFTHETWDAINTTLDAEHPDSRIVGWYHSHPGFSVFLSEYDTFIHHNFFSAPWQVAYVVDPLLGEDGFFGWEDGDLVRFAGWDVRAVYGRTGAAVREPAKHTETHNHQPAPPAKKPYMGLAAAGIIGLVAGVVAGTSLAEDPPKAPVTAVGADVVRQDGIVIHHNYTYSRDCITVDIRMFNPTVEPANDVIIIEPVPAAFATQQQCNGRDEPIGSQIQTDTGSIGPLQTGQIQYTVKAPDGTNANQLAIWDQERLALWQALAIQAPTLDQQPLRLPAGFPTPLVFRYADGSAVAADKIATLTRGWTVEPAEVAVIDDGIIIGVGEGDGVIIDAAGNQILQVSVRVMPLQPRPDAPGATSTTTDGPSDVGSTASTVAQSSGATPTTRVAPSITSPVTATTKATTTTTIRPTTSSSTSTTTGGTTTTVAETTTIDDGE